MPITTPQFDYPFRLDSNGLAVVVEQDSPQDVAACVTNIVICLQGQKLGDPAFGVPSLLFKPVPLQTQAKIAAIQRLEPRATLSSADIASLTQGPAVREMTTTVQVQGPPTVQIS